MSDATITGADDNSSADDKAARICRLLRQFGLDVDKACDLNFYFYFPRKTLCQAAASRLKWLGFAVSVERTSSGPNGWRCLAIRSQVPEVETLRVQIAQFQAIAAEFHGLYDGWDAFTNAGQTIPTPLVPRSA